MLLAAACRVCPLPGEVIPLILCPSGLTGQPSQGGSGCVCPIYCATKIVCRFEVFGGVFVVLECVNDSGGFFLESDNHSADGTASWSCGIVSVPAAAWALAAVCVLVVAHCGFSDPVVSVGVSVVLRDTGSLI